MRMFPSERVSMEEGAKLEVTYKRKDFKVVWYKARIEGKAPTNSRSRRRDLFLRLLKDDFSTPLNQLSKQVCTFRPIPPYHLQARVTINVDCVVDADYQGGWWIGIVVKELQDDNFLVLFDSLPDVVEFKRTDLRPHIDWIDEQWWEIPRRRTQFWKCLADGSVFIPGTMVEVIIKAEGVWVPAMIIKEIQEMEEGDEENAKNYIVKFCNKSLSCKGNKASQRKTFDFRCVRPTPPPYEVEVYRSLDYVEAFRGIGWRQGKVMRILSQKRYLVQLEATKNVLVFKHSDLRPFKVWENGVWKTPLSQALGNEMGGSVMNGNTPSLESPGIAATPWKETDAETQGNTFPMKTLPPMKNENCSESNEDNNRKRKREQNLSSIANVEETRAKKTAKVLPFEKKSTVWMTVELLDERLTMWVGRKIEICYKENGIEGIWHEAMFEATAKNKYRCRESCVQLLKDFTTSLSKDVLIRPVPPDHLQAQVDIKKGFVVDADYKGGWWTGLVVKETEDDKFLVLFDSPPDIIHFKRKDLRPHLDWVNEKNWVVPNPKLELLKRLTEDSTFSSGTMVEVSFNEVEVVWFPAMIIKAFEEDDDAETEDDEKKYIVKFFHKPLTWKVNKANVTIVDSETVRPTPPPFIVEEYRLLDCVEAYCGSEWRRGIVKEIISQKQYMVSFKGTMEQLKFGQSDLRPPMEWEDGVWKTVESPLPEGSGSENGNTAPLENKVVSHVTPSPVISVTPLGKIEAETPEKTLARSTIQPMRDQDDLGNDSTQEKERSKNNNGKRNREHSVNSVVNIEESRANDTTMVLPFEKKSPIWKTVESMEVFKTNPQSPHFSPLVKTRENSREMSAVGMMLTYSTLLEELKGLKLLSPVSALESLNDSFTELEKHGFDVKAPQSRILKMLSLRDREAKNIAELKVAKKEIEEKESEKVEIKRKILELKRLEEKTAFELAQMKSNAAKINQELEDVELHLQTTALAPW